MESTQLDFENESTRYKLYPSFVIFNALFILAKASSYSGTLFDFSIFLSIDISNLISFGVNSLFIYYSTWKALRLSKAAPPYIAWYYINILKKFF